MTRTPANGGGELAMKVGTVSVICIPYCHRAYDGETYAVRVLNSHWRHVILALAIKSDSSKYFITSDFQHPFLNGMLGH